MRQLSPAVVYMLQDGLRYIGLGAKVTWLARDSLRMLVQFQSCRSALRDWITPGLSAQGL